MIVVAILNALLLLQICFAVSRIAKALADQHRDRTPCPACDEQIKSQARICPFCRSDVIMARERPSTIVGSPRV